jgi:uncharacterized protein YfkK (UPF0435 family)
MIDIIQEDTSPMKEDSNLMTIIKLLLVVGQGVFDNIKMKNKSSLTFNDIVEIIKQGNDMIGASIDKMNTTNLEIKEFHA